MNTDTTNTIQLNSKGTIDAAWLYSVFGEIRSECVRLLETESRRAHRPEDTKALRQAATRVSRSWVILNGRLKTVAGRAHCLEGNPKFGKVEIATKIFSHESVSLEQLVETIKHEIAHVAATYRAGHGPEWKRLYKLMGGNGERYHDMKAAAESARTPKVRGEITCPRCSNVLGHIVRRGEGRIARWTEGRRSLCCSASIEYTIVSL
jgi:predicted SprT family Zn-dependent metalloprotease